MTLRPRQSLLNPALVRPSALTSVPRDPGLLWLDKNENLDPELLRLTHDVLKGLPPLTLATYPEAGDCYRKLARWVGVAPEQLILTPGSDGAIRLVFEAFIESGDAVIHTSPTFAMYPVYSQMYGADVTEIQYIPTDSGPELSPELIVKMLRRHSPKLFCLPNPDSPTGTVLAPNALREILSVCEEVGALLLLDEAYHPFHEWSAVPWSRESRNLVVARTFAKAWGVAGLRIGYAVAHPETIAYLHKMRPMYEVSTLSVEFMSHMLDHAPAMLESVKRVKAGKTHFVNAMEGMGFKTLPTAGNFVHVAFGKHGPAIHAALASKVLYRKNFDHPCLVGYSRFTVAPRIIMDQVVDPIIQVMGSV
jgi:histidinol-phosphate aminotransferase